MESYTFHTVQISAFDVHTAARPLGEPELLQEKFQFLADPDSYAARFEAAQPIPTQHFRVGSIPRWVREANHFWKKYLGLRRKGTAPDAWRLQAPFICKPSTGELTVVSDPNFTAKAEARVYLSATGWSTVVDLSLRGKMTAPQLRDFIGKLRTRSGPESPAVLEFEGQRKTLSELFRTFSTRIQQDIYTPAAGMTDVLSVSRHLVITPQRFAGPLNYFEPQLESQTRMPDEDRATMLSLLYGEAVSAPDMFRWDRDKHYSATHFPGGDPDFALTDFDVGTLFFPVRAAHEKNSTKRTRRQLHCAASNLRACSFMLYGLASLLGDTEASCLAREKPKVGTLLNGIKTSLALLPAKYTNEICRAFFRWYKPLKGLAPV